MKKWNLLCKRCRDKAPDSIKSKMTKRTSKSKPGEIAKTKQTSFKAGQLASDI